MGLAGSLADHAEFPGVGREEAPQDELLHQRREGLAGVLVELLKDPVGQAGEAAHRDVCEAAAGKCRGQHGFCAVRGLIGDDEKGGPSGFFFHVAGDIRAAAGGLARSGASENEMERHERLLS